MTDELVTQTDEDDDLPEDEDVDEGAADAPHSGIDPEDE